MKRLLLLAIAATLFFKTPLFADARELEPSLQEFIAAIKDLKIPEMGQVAMKDLRYIVRDRNRLRSWVMYYFSKKKRVEESRKGFDTTERLLDEVFPYMSIDLKKKVQRAIKYRNLLQCEKDSKESSHWHVDKTRIWLAIFCLVVAPTLGYLGGVFGGAGRTRIIVNSEEDNTELYRKAREGFKNNLSKFGFF